jgi:hypothetical protein
MATKNTKEKTIVLPITEVIYKDFLKDRVLAHELIEEIYKTEADFFPRTMDLNNYSLNGFTRVSPCSHLRATRSPPARAYMHD